MCNVASGLHAYPTKFELKEIYGSQGTCYRVRIRQPCAAHGTKSGRKSLHIQYIQSVPDGLSDGDEL